MPFSSRALPLHSRASLSSPRTVLTHPMHSTACTLLAFLPTLLCLCPRGRDEREHRSSLSRYGSGRKKTVVVVGKTLLYLIPIVLAALGVMNSEPAPSYLEKKRRGREKKKKSAHSTESSPKKCCCLLVAPNGHSEAVIPGNGACTITLCTCTSLQRSAQLLQCKIAVHRITRTS